MNSHKLSGKLTKSWFPC